MGLTSCGQILTETWPQKGNKPPFITVFVDCWVSLGDGNFNEFTDTTEQVSAKSPALGTD